MNEEQAGTEGSADASRAKRLALLARASDDELAAAWQRLQPPPHYRLVRRGETGLVMARGRAGATGRRFNLGEVTVSRATARLASGCVGHGYVLGRRRSAAERIAVMDGLLEERGAGAEGVSELLAIVRARLQRERTTAARRAAATRVEFFTLAREGGG